jgi:hypothetical protein
MTTTEAKTKLAWAISVIKLIEDGYLDEARQSVTTELDPEDTSEDIVDIYGNLVAGNPECLIGAKLGLVDIVNECQEVLKPKAA